MSASKELTVVLKTATIQSAATPVHATPDIDSMRTELHVTVSW